MLSCPVLWQWWWAGWWNCRNYDIAKRHSLQESSDSETADDSDPVIYIQRRNFNTQPSTLLIVTIDMIYEPTRYMDHFGPEQMWSIYKECTVLMH